jgi:hypothetical protein
MAAGARAYRQRYRAGIEKQYAILLFTKSAVRMAKQRCAALPASGILYQHAVRQFHTLPVSVGKKKPKTFSFYDCLFRKARHSVIIVPPDRLYDRQWIMLFHYLHQIEKILYAIPQKGKQVNYSMLHGRFHCNTQSGCIPMAVAEQGRTHVFNSY